MIKSKVFYLALFLFVGIGIAVLGESNKDLTNDLILSNIEALANGENGTVNCTSNGNGCYDGVWRPNDRE